MNMVLFRRFIAHFTLHFIVTTVLCTTPINNNLVDSSNIQKSTDRDPNEYLPYTPLIPCDAV